MSLALWFQRKMNARTTTRIRRKGGKMMGMEVMILHTVGRTSKQPRETPLSWFTDTDGSWLTVASGGGDRNPDWFANMMANPGDVAIEMHGSAAVPVTPLELDGPDRALAWRQITAIQPRYGKYQNKSDREYPVVRLTPR